jgi:hypothetical protein
MKVTDNFREDFQTQPWLNNEKIEWFKQIQNICASDWVAQGAPIVETDSIIVNINGRRYQINVLPL